MNSSRRIQTASCALPLPPVLLIGGLLSAGFFGLVLSGPLDYELFRRYCLSHPVAVASVCLFCVGVVGLGWKWWAARHQSAATRRAVGVLRRLVAEGQDIAPSKRSAWLAAHWQSQPLGVQTSWFGARVLRALELQISRGRRNQFESDLQTLAERDADRQHESYSLLRIINWAMPMLGFLGTVLGISQTLGQLDTKMLATQQQDAMNQLTAGLYVAFDTTAIALILTVCSMFLQFAVSRLETSTLAEIDSQSQESLIQFLSADPHDAQGVLLAPVREMVEDLIDGVRKLVVEQAALWNQSLEETQRQWQGWSTGATETIESQIGDRISRSLDRHVDAMSKLQDEGNRQQDLRWQQWQTTLSDQARLIQGQQKELVQQTSTLHALVESTSELRKLEDVISDSVGRLENVHRIEHATTCVGEAVAMLATCLERAGVIRGAPLRPRAAQRATAGEPHAATLPLAHASTSPPFPEPPAASGCQTEESADMAREQRKAA